MKVRPMGISIIAVAFILLGLFSFVWSLLVFGFGGLSTVFGSLFTLSPQVSGNLWSGLLGMLAGGVQLATGIGLLGMKTWSWYLAFIAVALNLVQGLLGMFSGGLLSFICAGLGLVIPLIIVIYLLRSEIRLLFGVGT